MIVQFDEKSHLLQMRGLKHMYLFGGKYLCKSHLLQMRGLKQNAETKGTAMIGRIFYRCVD